MPEDLLAETRYGDNVHLEANVLSPEGHLKMREQTMHMIHRYINSTRSIPIAPDAVFDISDDGYGDCIEQIIHASHGNFRRIIQLLDCAMIEAFTLTHGEEPVSLNNALAALRSHSNGNEMNSFSQLDREFLDIVAQVCRHRRTFRFTFPGMSTGLAKYTNRSREFNLVNVVEQGVGQRGTTYAFDYAYCIAHDIPTHYVKGSERISRDRSQRSAEWITKVTTISTALVEHASVAGKLDGTIDHWVGDAGYILGDAGQKYFFMKDFIIPVDQKKRIVVGHRVRFIARSIGTDSQISSAVAVELL